MTADWICFLGADNRYHAPDVLATMAAALEADAGEHTVAYGVLDKHSPRRHRLVPAGSRLEPAASTSFRRGEMIPHPATFHHRSLFERNGGFDESVRIRVAGSPGNLFDAIRFFVPVVVVGFP